MPTTRHQILLIEGHPLLRNFVSDLLALHFEYTVHTAATLAEARAELIFLPGLRAVIMDIALIDGFGAQSVGEIRSCVGDGVPILVFTDVKDAALAPACHAAGATGFLSKQSNKAHLVVAVKQTLAGKRVSARDPSAIGYDRVDSPAHDWGPVQSVQSAVSLTKRQHEVLHLIGQGLQNKRIARSLGLSESAIKAHVSKICILLQAKGRTHAAMLASELGLLRHSFGGATKNGWRGFTLIELLVVVAIIALLSSYVGPRFFTQIGKSERETARAQIDAFSKALDAYRIDTGHYPNAELGLNALVARPPNEPKWRGPYLQKAVPGDPWGNPYQFSNPGKQGDYDLLSFGKDGKPGGSDDNADLSNWN